jgi:hypothetical protein
MNTRPDLERTVTDWLHAEATSAGSDRILAAALVRVAEVGQERTPRLGRIFDMNTYAKLAIGAAAIVLIAVAGFGLLSNGPSQGGPAGLTSPSPTAPSPTPAESVAVATPLPVALRFEPGDDIGDTTLTEVRGRVQRRGTVWAPTITLTNDPRLDGTMSIGSPADTYAGPAGSNQFALWTETYRIENAGGAWTGSVSGFSVADQADCVVVVLAGSGGYAGLYAALDLTDYANVRGVIFPAPPPRAAPPLPTTSPSTSGAPPSSTPTDSPAVAPLPVTFSFTPGDDIAGTTLTDVDGHVERRGTVFNPTIDTASDPRLAGTMLISSPADYYPGADGPESFALSTDTIRIQGDDGAWQGSVTGFSAPGQSVCYSVILAGQGAYTGLYAALDMTDYTDVHGVIFPAPPPSP